MSHNDVIMIIIYILIELIPEVAKETIYTAMTADKSERYVFIEAILRVVSSPFNQGLS